MCAYNPKGRLQEFCQKNHLSMPEYTTIEISGPAHMHVFTVECVVSGRASDEEDRKGYGRGTTLKAAHQDAAADLIRKARGWI